MSQPDPALRVLFVCTANQCRSPMAEVLLRHHLERLGVSAETSSCGLMEGGMPAADIAVEAAAGLGLDLSGHVSRQLDRDLVSSADLIVPMTRQHLREVVVLAPDAFAKTFTLKELDRRAAAAGPRDTGQPLADYLARLSEGRRAQDLMGESTEDDVADPMGLGLGAARDTATELNGLCARVASALAG